MGGLVVLLLLVFVMQTYTKDLVPDHSSNMRTSTDELVDTVANALVNRALKVFLLYHRGLDSTTLAKKHHDKSLGAPFTRPALLVPRSSVPIRHSPFPVSHTNIPFLASHSMSPLSHASILRTETAAATNFKVGGVQPRSVSQQVSLVELLSTCIDACSRGCSEIRHVHSGLQRTNGVVQQVDYKIANEAKSAMTEADLRAQAAIVNALQDAWPGLRIVGEEDPSELVKYEGNTSALPSLRRDICKLPDVSPPLTAALDDITIFVDPLDGTQEFVEGRVENVQTLVGIAVRGQAVAGAVGLPFAAGTAGGGSNEAAVVYALVGAGVGVYGERPKSNGPFPDAGERPLLVVSDNKDPALAAAYSAALARGGRRELLGGTGQKVLAVAEGRADIAILNDKSSSWDTCASEAIIRTLGGEITDIFGEQIVYSADPPPPATYLNTLGVIATSAPFRETHHTVCAAMRRNSYWLERLEPWGLKMDELAGKANVTEVEVERVLGERLEKLRHSL